LTVIFLGLWVGLPSPSAGQTTPDEESRLQILNDPAAISKKVEKEKTLPPFEFFRSQVAPFDVLPYMKANHWSTLTLELRANRADFEGALESFPLLLHGMPQEVSFRRPLRLIKEQRSNLSLQVMPPQVPRELLISLSRTDAIRAEEIWQASLRTLEPHQMLVVVLSKEANSSYAPWGRLTSLIPSTAERDSPTTLELQRYYRLVLPLEVDRIPLSPHPLSWTPISHVIWDGLAPDVLGLSQQEAMLDWLHWGGQLILVGGAGANFSLLRDSFLSPYLPATASSENRLLSAKDLAGLSAAYRPPVTPPNPNDSTQPVPLTRLEAYARFGRRYLEPAPIQPAPGRPVYLTGLTPELGATTIPLDKDGSSILAVERRVGRGRITMLALNPTDPSLMAWGGIDTLIRRVILRRPEEMVFDPGSMPLGDSTSPQFRISLTGPDLSWYRITSRDTGLPSAPAPNPESTAANRGSLSPDFATSSMDFTGAGTGLSNMSRQGVAEWLDGATFPLLAAEQLEKSSGITIPNSRFVLNVILAYLLVLVPLNWLLCRFVFNRREWAWAIVPFLAIGFGVAVERVAAFDIGFESALDEVDLLELQGDYPRGHLTRFASIYSTSRSSYALSFPNDPTALCLPLDTRRSIGGEDRVKTIWQSYPIPTLAGFLVQPRSLSMFRAEQMMTLSGTFRIEEEGASKTLLNESGLEIHDAVLIDATNLDHPIETKIGTIKPGESIDLKNWETRANPAISEPVAGPDPTPFLDALRQAWELRPENRGEIRLVGWTQAPRDGLTVEPEVDRRRGFTAVLAHIRMGPPPSPDSFHYDATRTDPSPLEPGADRKPADAPFQDLDPTVAILTPAP
jgi:hypothetical protein